MKAALTSALFFLRFNSTFKKLEVQKAFIRKSHRCGVDVRRPDYNGNQAISAVETRIDRGITNRISFQSYS